MNLLRKITLSTIVLLCTLYLFSQPGVLDNSFNGNGLVITNGANGIHDNGRAVLVQSDEKIIVVGSSEGRVGLIRYTPDGNLDSSFGSNGIVLTPYGNDNIYGLCAVLQDDEKIIVGGAISVSSNYDFAVLRYNTDGSLDDSFGLNGIASKDLGVYEVGFAVDLQADGRILLAGTSSEMMGDYALVRFNQDGTLDETFGSDGSVVIENSGMHDEIYGVKIKPDGKIVASGYSRNFNNDISDFMILQLNNDGSLDESFNSTGIVVTDFISGSLDESTSIAVQPDGKIIAGGVSEAASDQDFALARYNSDGSLDQSFNQTGLVRTNLGSFDDYATALCLQPDGKIILAGFASSPTDVDYVIVRYNIDGTIDESFGNNGMTWTDFGVGDDKAKAICLDHDGKILVAGYSGDLPASDFDYSLARYLNDLSIGLIDFSESSYHLLVFPNPIQNNTTLEYELNDDEIISLSLYDYSGNCIKHFFTSQIREKGEHWEVLNIDPTIPTGNYLLVLGNGKHYRSIRISIK